MGSGGPAQATISRGFCKAEFPWEHVLGAQGAPPSQPASRVLGKGWGSARRSHCLLATSPHSPEMKLQANWPFFFTFAFKGLAPPWGASGVAGVGFDVAQSPSWQSAQPGEVAEASASRLPEGASLSLLDASGCPLSTYGASASPNPDSEGWGPGVRHRDAFLPRTP